MRLPYYNSPRDEASSTTIGSMTYVLGGVGESSIEGLDVTQDEPEWELGPEMPRISARACAVATDDNTIYVIGGHAEDPEVPLGSGLVLDITEGKWTDIPAMNEARRDHACLYVEFEKNKGILVTGGN